MIRRRMPVQNDFMSEKLRDNSEEFTVAAHEARVAAARAREAAEAFEEFAELLAAGDYQAASETHLKAVGRLEAAGEAAAACDDWLMKSSDPT